MDELVARHVLDCTPRLITPIRFQLWGSDESSARYWGCGCGGHLHAIYPHSDAPSDTHHEQGRLASYSTIDWYSLSVLDAMHRAGHIWTVTQYRPAVETGNYALGIYRVLLTLRNGGNVSANADSLAIAVCRAALIAVMDLEPGQGDTNAG